MNKKVLVFIIGILVAIACFRSQVNTFLFKPKEAVEAPIEVNTTLPDPLVSTVFFTPAEIEWLNANESTHLTQLSRDDERLRVKAFIATQKREDKNLVKYIDSLKLAHPELKDADLTKLPEFTGLGQPIE
jgi:hypothetical protein